MIASLAIIVAGHARTIALPALLRGRPLSPNSRSFIPRSLSTPQGPNFTGYTPLATLTSCIRHANRLIALETPKLDIMRTKPSQCRTTVHVHVMHFLLPLLAPRPCQLRPTRTNKREHSLSFSSPFYPRDSPLPSPQFPPNAPAPSFKGFSNEYEYTGFGRGVVNRFQQPVRTR
jgi:hypothetical protein